MPPPMLACRYLNAEELINDTTSVFDTAIAIHSPSIWRGDSVQGEEILRRAVHMKQFFTYQVHETMADVVPALGM
jgi:hypothetical protein